MIVGKLIGLILLFILIGYSIGSILFGLIVAKSQKVDIRSMGSGNVGATNIARNMGKINGGVVMLLDFFKSWLATFICLLIYKVIIKDNSNAFNYGFIVYFGGFAAVIGHCFPYSYFYVLFKYKFDFSKAKKYSGGKGVATAAGFLAAVSPWYFFIGFIIFWTIFSFTKYVSLSSISTAFFAPLWILIPYLNYFYMLNVANTNIIENFPTFNNCFKVVNIFNYTQNWIYILVLFVLVLIVAFVVIIRHKENIIRLINHKESKFSFAKKTKK